MARRSLKHIPTGEVIRLYRDENWTAERIAEKYGIAYRTVFNWLEEAGVRRRPAARQSFKADPKEIKDLYTRKKMSTEEIGQQFGVDQMTILRFLKRHDVALRPRGRYSRQAKTKRKT